MLRFIPTYSILLFAILFIAASILYPGGSDFDLQAKGFSWLHNYWCNLTATIAKNGMPNPAQPVALTAQFVLCIGLLFFWYQLPRLFSEKPIYKSIRYFGCSAILVGSLSFTSLHEWAIKLGQLILVRDRLFFLRNENGNLLFANTSKNCCSVFFVLGNDCKL